MILTIFKAEMNKANYTINEQLSVKDAMKAINESSLKNVFVVNDSGQVIGSITDGDIRRGILDGASTEDKLTKVMNDSFHYLSNDSIQTQKIAELKKDNIYLVPVLDQEKMLVKVINLKEYYNIIPIDAIIMAGGQGKRLLPFTLETPKPLLVVGDKPIIEHNIDRLIKFGIEDITISINYLKNQIKDYFGTGSDKAIQIDYIEETEALGTAGAVSLKSNFKKDYILLMNSDLLTDIDYGEMFDLLIESEADLIVATFPYNVSVPYGVVETDGDAIIGLNEKPTYTYYSNAGIYMFKKSCVEKIPKGEFFNATDLMDELIKSGQKVVHFPILSYWLDIGKPRDFEKAQKDIEHLNL